MNELGALSVSPLLFEEIKAILESSNLIMPPLLSDKVLGSAKTWVESAKVKMQEKKQNPSVQLPGGATLQVSTVQDKPKGEEVPQVTIALDKVKPKVEEVSQVPFALHQVTPKLEELPQVIQQVNSQDALEPPAKDLVNGQGIKEEQDIQALLGHNHSQDIGSYDQVFQSQLGGHDFQMLEDQDIQALEALDILRTGQFTQPVQTQSFEASYGLEMQGFQGNAIATFQSIDNQAKRDQNMETGVKQEFTNIEGPFGQDIHGCQDTQPAPGQKELESQDIQALEALNILSQGHQGQDFHPIQGQGQEFLSAQGQGYQTGKGRDFQQLQGQDFQQVQDQDLQQIQSRDLQQVQGQDFQQVLV